MPISNEKVYRDFLYEWQAEDGQSYSYPMKLIHTDLGPIIQIHIGDEGGIDLPAEMFIDVSTYLIENRDIKGKLPAPKVPVIGNKSIPTNRPRVGIPMPTNSVRNPLVPQEPLASLQNIQDQPPATDVDPEEILKQRMDAKAKASASRRIKKDHKVQQAEDTE